MLGSGNRKSNGSIADALDNEYEKSANAFESFRETGARTLDYGVICFGNEKKEGFIRIGNGPLLAIPITRNFTLRILYIATIDVVLVLSYIFFIVTGNPWLLIFFVLLTIYFFVL